MHKYIYIFSIFSDGPGGASAPPRTPPIASAFGDTDGEIFGRKNFRQKKFSAGFFFDRKAFRPKKNKTIRPIIFWSKNFSAKQNVGRKIFGRKHFRPKTNSAKNVFGRTIFQPKFRRPHRRRRKQRGGFGGAGTPRGPSVPPLRPTPPPRTE